MSAAASAELTQMLQTAGMELVVSRYMPSEPRLEKVTLSGCENLSARERNERLLRESCRVYEVKSMPGKLFCSPWVYEVLMAGLADDADDRIDALYAREHAAIGRAKEALVWKLRVAESLRAGQMSRYFWKRNPKPDLACIDELILAGQRLAR